jgi:hypothetical protein
MAITRARTSSVAQGPSTRKTVLGGNDVILGGSYDAIATANGTGSSGVITFSSIPSTYKHLQIRWISKSTSTGSYNTLNFNSDTASNYSTHILYGDGATVTSSWEATQPRINLYGSSVTSTATNVYATHVIDILDYTSTNKNKTVRALGGQDSNGSGVIFLTSGLWRNSSTAINSITITANASNFTTASQFDLYGIK